MRLKCRLRSTYSWIKPNCNRRKNRLAILQFFHLEKKLFQKSEGTIIPTHMHTLLGLRLNQIIQCKMIFIFQEQRGQKQNDHGAIPGGERSINATELVIVRICQALCPFCVFVLKSKNGHKLRLKKFFQIHQKTSLMSNERYMTKIRLFYFFTVLLSVL